MDTKLVKDFLFNNFFNMIRSNFDFDVYKIVSSFDGVFVAGGAITSVLTNSKINDYDLFFVDEVKSTEVLNKFLESGFIPVFICENNKLITLKRMGVKVQFIKEKYYSTYKDVILDFDLVPCCVSASLYRKEFIVHDDYFDCIVNKKIKINKISYPYASFNRIIKYMSRGYELEKIDLYEFCKEVSNFQKPNKENDSIDWRKYID